LSIPKNVNFIGAYAIRKSGIINMWGAAPLLKDLYPELSRTEANEILCNWISNYDALNDAFGWR
jgi:hypothetical protein